MLAFGLILQKYQVQLDIIHGDKMNNWNIILKDFAYKCGKDGPDMTNSNHLAWLRESLLKFGWKENTTNEFVGNLREAACKVGQNPEDTGCEPASGGSGKDKKDKKDKKEVKHSLKTDTERDKKLHEVAELFIDDDAEKVKGSGRFRMSKEDVKKYREWLKLSPEQRRAKIDKIKADQEEKLGGPVTEEDVDKTIEELKIKLRKPKIDPKTGKQAVDKKGNLRWDNSDYNALVSSIKKKGDPPPENSKGDRGNQRFRDVVRYYLETGGVSPITGQVVPFHDSQLDHIVSLDNGGEDGPGNWMGMESRFNQFKGKLTDPEVERKLIEKGLMTVNEINKETSEQEFDQWKNEAEVAYWETQFESGNPANISQEKIDNMSAEELDNFVKAWNNHVGEGDPRYIPRYGTRKTEVKGSEKPLAMSRGGDVKPDKNNPDSWGLHKGGDGTMSEPTLKDDPDGYKKALAIYEKSRQSGGAKITSGEVRDNIKGRLSGDDSPFEGPIPDASEEERMDEVMEAIQGEKIDRKREIDALNDKIKENPKSSSAAKKRINKELKDTGIPDEIKKAKGKGSAKEPDDPEAYNAAIKKKNDFLLTKWREWEKSLESK
jgi:hypothetical protein